MDNLSGVRYGKHEVSFNCAACGKLELGRLPSDWLCPTCRTPNSLEFEALKLEFEALKKEVDEFLTWHEAKENE